MPDKKPNFLESIAFQEDFLPFKGPEINSDGKILKKGTKIEFGGENEVQNMIEFYLKNKGIKDSKGNIISPEENAKRFKINCVLANNGGGKSRLFESIYRFFNTGIIEGEILREPIFNGNIKIGDNIISYPNHSHLHHFNNNGNGTSNLLGSLINNTSEFENLCILNDDFFKLSGNINFSVNKDILNGHNYNKFYSDLFNDIGKFKNIYPGFLNIGNDFKTSINIDFKDWKNNYKGDYFDFLNYNSDYNGETDNRNVKDEISFGGSLDFFELLAKTYNAEDTSLHKFGIKKEEAKEIWLYLSELFLLTVNHFDEYLSLDDEFIKEMVIGRQRMSGKSQPGFKEKGLFAYDSYSDYKKSLNLLETYLKINIELLNKNIFTDYYLREQERRKDIKISLEQISFNLDILLKNLKEIETEVISNKKNKGNYGYLEYQQKYFFKNINGNQNKGYKFIDKIQGSKYSSQSKYLLINLLFGYSNIDQYTSNIDKNIYQTETIENNKNKIRDLNFYVFDGPIEYFSEKVLNKNFSYNGSSKLSESEINFIRNNSINCDIEFYDIKKDNIKSFNNLSAGEKTMLTRFTNISRYIFESKKTDFLILIDEPDLHLHLDWQRQYIQKLIDVFSTLDSEIKLHFIIATHSPFIISDLPKESLVLLDKGEQIEYEGETFGANYIDIIKNGFFFDQKKFMGSFAEEVIGEVAQSKRKDLMNMPDNNDKEIMSKIEENIGDKFLKNNLVYFKSKKYDKSGY